MNPESESSTPARAIVRAAVCAVPALLAAGAAHAGTAELTHQTLHGIVAYFADPGNVRGLFGAAGGALVSILAARPFARGGAEDTDDP